MIELYKEGQPNHWRVRVGAGYASQEGPVIGRTEGCRETLEARSLGYVK